MKTRIPFLAWTVVIAGNCGGGEAVEPPDVAGEPPQATCVPSGDQRNINSALTAVGSVAVLCGSAVFELTAPVVFSRDGQQLYTEGFPTDSTRALLRIVDPAVTTAVHFLNRSNVAIRNVIVDGNRPALGLGDGALLQGGGDASGQVIEWVRAYEPRGWTTLHVFEGGERRCSNALVQNNEFGPAGQPDGTWADGISLACRNSVVKNNTVVDATDGGIVVFGAPGSLIANNTIRAERRSLLGGINMVDYLPFDGDYTGTRVEGNVIEAAGRHVKIGLGMGLRVWVCIDPANPDPRFPPDGFLQGAVVSGNILRGDSMQYGFAVDGVKDWTVLGNVDLSMHVGSPTHACLGQVPDPPGGYQKHGIHAQGTFQPEFREAYLELALWAIPR